MSLSGGVDFLELTEESIIFLPGVTSQTVTLQTLRDELVEGDETLSVRLTHSPDNVDNRRVELTVPEATVTITEETCTYH